MEHKIYKGKKTNGRFSNFPILFYCCFQGMKRKSSNEVKSDIELN